MKKVEFKSTITVKIDGVKVNWNKLDCDIRCAILERLDGYPGSGTIEWLNEEERTAQRKELQRKADGCRNWIADMVDKHGSVTFDYVEECGADEYYSYTDYHYGVARKDRNDKIEVNLWVKNSMSSYDYSLGLEEVDDEVVIELLNHLVVFQPLMKDGTFVTGLSSFEVFISAEHCEEWMEECGFKSNEYKIEQYSHDDIEDYKIVAD